MSKTTSSPTDGIAGDLEARMQRVSLVVSLFSLGLMAAGFVDIWLGGASLALPGAPALPLSNFISLSPGSLGLDAMSAGIVLLALLPVARVVLALWLYVRARDLLDSTAALVVILILLFSLASG